VRCGRGRASSVERRGGKGCPHSVHSLEAGRVLTLQGGPYSPFPQPKHPSSRLAASPPLPLLRSSLASCTSASHTAGPAVSTLSHTVTSRRSRYTDLVSSVALLAFLLFSRTASNPSQPHTARPKLTMSIELSGACAVCCTETTQRCSSCAEHGFDFFLCGQEHQKLVRSRSVLRPVRTT
jgi:hypothetical protein